MACDNEESDPGFGNASPGPSSGPTPTATLPNNQEPTALPSSGSTLQAELPLQISDVVFTGEFDGDAAGGAVAAIGDINLDGFPDFAIGAPFSSARQPDGGKVYLYFGQKDVFDWQMALSNAPASLDGEARGARAGTAICGGGDLNGDGAGDLIISAPGHSAGGIDAGRLYVIFGRAQGWFPGQRLGNADVIFDGFEGEGIGEPGALAMGGDLDGDGFDDIAIGAPSASTFSPEAGHVRLIFGHGGEWENNSPIDEAGGVIVGDQARARFGFSVTIHPDFDGDGLADLLVSAPRLEIGDHASLGAVYLFRGGPKLRTARLSASDADAVLYGVLPGEELGASIAALGDITGDGQVDIAIGAWGNTSDELSSTKGRYYIVSNALRGQTEVPIDTISMRLIGDAPGDFAGRPAANGGDINGDGRSDVLFGAYLRDYPDLDAGNAYLYYGWREGSPPSDGSLQGADVRFVGEKKSNYAGFALSSAGDINQDGYDDILIGALGADTATLQGAGKAYLIYGQGYFTD